MYINIFATENHQLEVVILLISTECLSHGVSQLSGDFIATPIA
jgi:hypothetical protein